MNNTFKDNLFILFVLGTLTVVSIDLRSELARDKREIESIIVILEKTEKQASVFELSYSIFDLVMLGLHPTCNVPVQANDVLKFPKERSPPGFSF